MKKSLTNNAVFLLLWLPLAIWVGSGYLVDQWFREYRIAYMVYFALPLTVYLMLALVPRTRSHRVCREFIKSGFKTVGLYVLLVVAGSVLLLLASSAVGYLPYSDRPGPGWGNVPVHLPRLEEVKYFASWAVLLLPMCYYFGALLFAFIAWIRWLKAPTWLVRAAGGLFCAGISMLSIAAAGWYIAIAVFVTNSVGVLGLLFGLLILPRMSLQREQPLSLAVRITGIASACLVMTAILVYPFLR
jgi:hypothetical protein